MAKSDKPKQDLDSILSEINASIKKQPSKSDAEKADINTDGVNVSRDNKDSKENNNKPQSKPQHSKSKKKTTKKDKLDKEKRSVGRTGKAGKADKEEKAINPFSSGASGENDAGKSPPPKDRTVKFISVTAIEENDVDSSDEQVITLNGSNRAEDEINVIDDFNPTSEVQKTIVRKKPKPRKTKRQKRTAVVGGLITIFLVIGVISTVFSGIVFTKNAINNTAQKQELAKEIFPFVIVDVPEFDNPSKLDNSAIISSSIWEFIIDKQDKSQYPKDDLGSIYVHEVEIEKYVRQLYGNDIKIKHQTVDGTSVGMTYDEEAKTYCIESTPKFLPYKPRVDKITKSKDIYTLKVSYILPDAMWNFEADDRVEIVDKTMEYVLKKNKDSYQILSVKLLSLGGTTPTASQAVTFDDIKKSDLSSEETSNTSSNTSSETSSTTSSDEEQ